MDRYQQANKASIFGIIGNIILLILELVLCNIHAAIDANTTINAILIIVINKEFPNTFIKSNCSHALV